MRTRGGGWTFRARFAALIAALFTTAGVLVLIVQYFVVAGLLEQEVREVSIGNAPTSIVPTHPSGTAASDALCASAGNSNDDAREQNEDCIESITGTNETSGTADEDTTGVATSIRDTVLQRMGLATSVIITVFTMTAVALAWWLAGRSLSRLREVTRLARTTSERDLHGRLDLPGPADEIKELGDTIDRMLARLEHAFDERTRFVANASHELRTPLAANRAALEAPLTQGRFPHEVVPDIERALAANARSSSIITALLQLARGEVDPATTGPIDLADLVEAALDGYSDRIHQRQLKVHTELEHATVQGNQMLLIQSIDNLLDNATRYTTEHGHFRIATAATAAGAKLTIVNDGERYTEVEASHLIEPFHRGRNSRTDTTGHGLGLAIVRAIVTNHRGHITVSARNDGGLSVTVLIPYAMGESTTGAAP